jgi:hypothetical protein
MQCAQHTVHAIAVAYPEAAAAADISIACHALGPLVAIPCCRLPSGRTVHSAAHARQAHPATSSSSSRCTQVGVQPLFEFSASHARQTNEPKLLWVKAVTQKLTRQPATALACEQPRCSCWHQLSSTPCNTHHCSPSSSQPPQPPQPALRFLSHEELPHDHGKGVYTQQL